MIATDSAYLEGFILAGLAERYGVEELSKLDSHSRGLLEAMVRDHLVAARLASGHVRDLIIPAITSGTTDDDQLELDVLCGKPFAVLPRKRGPAGLSSASVYFVI